MYECLYIQQMLITMLCVLVKTQEVFYFAFILCLHNIICISISYSRTSLQMCDITVITNRIGVSI